MSPNLVASDAFRTFKKLLFSIVLLLGHQQSIAEMPPASSERSKVTLDLVNDVITRANKIRLQGVSFQLNERKFFPNNQHSVIEVAASENQVKILFSFDKASLEKPELLFHNLIFLSAITSVGVPGTDSLLQFDPSLAKKLGTLSAFIFPKSGFRFVSNWIETLQNAQLGSLRAKWAVASIAQFALEHLIMLPTLDFKLSKMGLTKEKFDEILRSSKSQQSLLATQVKSLEENNERSLARRRSLEDKNQAAILSELIMKNDRKGVAHLFRTNLPWEMMEPTEKQNWLKWIDAIENPDSRNTTILFRGFGIKNKTFKRESSWAFIASSMNDFGTIVDLFQRSRSSGNAFKDLGVETSTISLQAKRHAFSSMHGSLFLSFSLDYMLAASFAGTETELPKDAHQGLLGVRIDQRRLVVNFTSEMNEKEYLVPLIVFPDEVLFVKEVTYDNRHQLKDPEVIKGVIAEIKKSGADLGINMITDEVYMSDRFQADVDKTILSLFGKSANRQKFGNTVSCKKALVRP